MPNWCEGTLKVRGKVKDIKKFVVEGLKPVNLFGTTLGALEFDEFDCVSSKSDCYIENTYRGFVENLYVEIYEEDDEDDDVIFFDVKFAWDVNAKELLKLCKKYKVDMKIYAFERGAEFNRDIEIIDGEIIKDEEIQFDDYRWECICPSMGG